MKLQLFRHVRWLLPLLAALTFGLVAPQALADRDDRGHGRHGQHYKYDKHYKHYKHYKLYKHYRHHRRHGHYRHAPRSRVRVEHYYYQEPSHYYYREHRHHREHRRPGTSISVTLPLGTIVQGLPGGYVSFQLGGDPYYYHGGNYYRPYYRSYRVVSPPPGHR